MLINAGQANAATVSCVTVARCFTYLSHLYHVLALLSKEIWETSFFSLVWFWMDHKKLGCD